MPTKPVISLPDFIVVVRGRKVVLDFGLADLCGVPASRLDQAVQGNLTRFPSDFIFQLTNQELAGLKSQIVTSNGRGGRRKLSKRLDELESRIDQRPGEQDVAIASILPAIRKLAGGPPAALPADRLRDSERSKQLAHALSLRPINVNT